MKTTIIIFLASSVICFAGLSVRLHVAPGPSAEQIASAKAAAEEKARQQFQPRDPWRLITTKQVVNGSTKKVETTSYAKGEYWVQISGMVIQVNKGSIVFYGHTGAPPIVTNAAPRMYCLTNFPYACAPRTMFLPQHHWMARTTDLTAKVTTLNYGEQSVPILDYGRIVNNQTAPKKK